MKLLPLWIRLIRFNWSSFIVICFIYHIWIQSDPIWHRDSIGSLKPMQESSRGADHGSGLHLHMSLYAGNYSEHVYTLLIGYRSGGTPGFHTFSGCVTELRAVDEGAVPASAPATSRLFVLAVATRRWVSTDNSGSLSCSPKPGRYRFRWWGCSPWCCFDRTVGWKQSVKLNL